MFRKDRFLFTKKQKERGKTVKWKIMCLCVLVPIS